MARKKPAASAEIRRMVRRIVQEFNPEKVILFGSRARGDDRPDSDVYLLVFVAFTIRQPGSMRLLRPISARYMHQKEIERYET